MNNMYDGTATWNPFKGCGFDCVYCKPSFQRQSKRWGKNNCEKCYKYEPHFHPERLDRIPSADIIFVGGSSDISFCSTENIMKIIDAIKDHNPRKDKTYYFQSKNPVTFKRFMNYLPDNCVLLTTLETDKHFFTGGRNYSDYSEAPTPLKRVIEFSPLDYPRKVVTVEPVMEFSTNFDTVIEGINPEYVWLGYNTKPGQVQLPEPSEQDVKKLISDLNEADIEVRGKDLRGIDMGALL